MASDSSDGEEWEENGTDGTPCTCLFCKTEEKSAEAVLNHLSENHNFDLLSYTDKLGLDFYSSVQLVNYIRKEQPSIQKLHEATPPFQWSKEIYMVPVIEDDPLLQLDFEPNNVAHNGLSYDKRLEEAEARARQCEESLKRALADLQNMRKAVQRMVGVDNKDVVQKLEEDQDQWGKEDSYFASYSHYLIHEEMLKDEARTETYRYFIEKNKKLFADKVVLDVGCGTGILAMIAAKAGAKQVFAVDNSSIAYKAMDIVRENKLGNVVQVFKSKIEEVTLPVDKVDIIVSEWMGYFLLYESMLDSVIYARDKWLVNPEHLYPNEATMSMVALCNKCDYISKIDFWDDVCGFKMGCIKQETFVEPSVQIISNQYCISSVDVIKKFNLAKVIPQDLEFETSFSLTMSESNTCYSFLGFFDANFEDVENPARMSTGPVASPTHWKQTIFYLREPFRVYYGDVVKGTLSLRKNTEEPRALVIQIKYSVTSLHQDTNNIRGEQTFGMA